MPGAPPPPRGRGTGLNPASRFAPIEYAPDPEGEDPSRSSDPVDPTSSPADNAVIKGKRS
jgi:hypothetical protein